jgi:RHS repeat-associated protein
VVDSSASQTPFTPKGDASAKTGQLHYYAKARYYDPELGLFLTEDPFQGVVDVPPSLHKYLYAHANPTVYFDPTGMCVFGLPCPKVVEDAIVDVAYFVVGFAEGAKEKQESLELAKEKSPYELFLEPWVQEAVRIESLLFRVIDADLRGGFRGMLEERDKILDEELARLEQSVEALPIVRTLSAMAVVEGSALGGDSREAARHAGQRSLDATEDALLALGLARTRGVIAAERSSAPGAVLRELEVVRSAPAKAPTPATRGPQVLEQAQGRTPRTTGVGDNARLRLLPEGETFVPRGIIARGDAALDFVPSRYRTTVSRSFRGEPVAEALTEDLIVYRRWSGSAVEIGSPWFSPQPYAHPGNARRYLALPQDNTAASLTAFRIPRGTVVLRRKVGTQVGVEGFGDYALGGGTQIYLPDPSVAIPIR